MISAMDQYNDTEKRASSFFLHEIQFFFLHEDSLLKDQFGYFHDDLMF